MLKSPIYPAIYACLMRKEWFMPFSSAVTLSEIQAALSLI